MHTIYVDADACPVKDEVYRVARRYRVRVVVVANSPLRVPPNSLVELDPHLRHLLVPDTATDKGALLPFGGLEIEWETRELGPGEWQPDAPLVIGALPAKAGGQPNGILLDRVEFDWQ